MFSVLLFPLLGAILIALILVANALRHLALNTSSPEKPPQETARILVSDIKFGMRAQERAIALGDAILEPLQKESVNFTALNSRNAFWIADVLGSIHTSAAQAILQELYKRPAPLARLVGAIGLGQHGCFPDTITEEHFLVQTVRLHSDQGETQLAIIALGWTRSSAALPCLNDVLQGPPCDYWHRAYAAEALSRIGDRSSIVVLRECLRRADFYAAPEAFRALIVLGDRQAIPLAIARIDPALKKYNSVIVRELAAVTGKKFGYNQKAWQRWWDSVESTWQVPQNDL